MWTFPSHENTMLKKLLRLSSVSQEALKAQLVETLVRIVIDHAGADRAVLILSEGDDFVIEADAGARPDGVEVRLERTPVAPGRLCESVFRHVQQTRQSVVLDDASEPGMFSDDEYVRRRNSRSILCIPLLKEAELVGVLYVENGLTPGAFTPHRVAMLGVLASRAAGALEKAQPSSDLAEQRARLQAAIRQVPVGLLIAEAPSGHLITANDQSQAAMDNSFHFSGFIAENGDCVGFHADGRPYTPSEWPLARSTRTGETVSGEEIEMLWPDGTRGFIAVSSAPIRGADGNISAGVAIIHDVTERRRREEALRASEERFSRLFQDNPTPMAVISAGTWTFVDANESFLRMLGYARSEVLGHAAFELGTWFVALMDEAARRLGEAKSFGGMERSAFAKSGEPLTLLASIDTIELGVQSCFLASFVDITARSRVEELARHSQQMEDIGNLARGIAHDFNNLLTVINGYSEMMLRSMDPSDSNYEFIRSIRNSGQCATALTRRLLTFSRDEVA